MNAFDPGVPDVSVIIPAYQVAEWIDEAVESVAGGPGAERVEVIVVDDGSTDATPQHLAALQARFGNVVVHRQENAGLGPARNAGVRIARGRYLAFLDGDDRFVPGALTKLVQRADEADVRLLVAGRVKFPQPWADPPWASDMAKGPRVITTLGQAPGLAHDLSACDKLFAREWFVANGWQFPARLFEDVTVTTRAYASAGRIALDPIVLLEYRQRGDGTSLMDGALSQVGVGEHLDAVRDAIDAVRDADPGTRTAIHAWILMRQMYYLRRAAAVLGDDELLPYMRACSQVFDALDEQALDEVATLLPIQVRLMACRCDRPDLLREAGVGVGALEARDDELVAVVEPPIMDRDGYFHPRVLPVVRASIGPAPVLGVARRSRVARGVSRALAKAGAAVEMSGDLVVPGARFGGAFVGSTLSIAVTDSLSVPVSVLRVDGQRAVWRSDPFSPKVLRGRDSVLLQPAGAASSAGVRIPLHDGAKGLNAGPTTPAH